MCGMHELQRVSRKSVLRKKKTNKGSQNGKKNLCTRSRCLTSFRLYLLISAYPSHSIDTNSYPIRADIIGELYLAAFPIFANLYQDTKKAFCIICEILCKENYRIRKTKIHKFGKKKKTSRKIWNMKKLHENKNSLEFLKILEKKALRQVTAQTRKTP